MLPLSIPETFKVYLLIKASCTTTLQFTTVGSGASSNYIGIGFFLTRIEAEQNLMLETLKNLDDKNKYYIYELDVPNPVYKND